MTNRFQQIFDAAFEFLAALSPDGTVLSVNQTALSYVDASLEEVVGKPFWETPWWRQEPLRARLRESVAMAAGGAFVRFDVVHQDRRGKDRTFDFSLKPVLDGSGAVALLIAEGRDVEDYVRFHSRFRELLEAAPDGIIEVDALGNVVLMNNAAEKVLGYTRDELLGQPIDTLVPDELRGIHESHRQRYAAAPASRPMGSGLELRARRKDGSEVPVEISLSPIRSQDGQHAIAIVRDVTARRESERQFRELQDRFTGELASKNRELELRNAEVERSNRLKSEFLASMSHELRSPLHTIIGFAELLAEELEGPLNDKQKRFVRNIHQDSHHLLAIINDLLDISKIEAGRMVIRMEPFDMADALEEVMATVEQQAAAKSLQIVRAWPAGATLEADRLRFKQILVNLLTNAIKFTPEGGRIQVTARPRGRRMAIAVSDTGVGIAREDHEAIFDKFYQVGSTTKGVREGTGLGLAITKKLVEQQGGRIWVDSELGEGSVFIFTVACQPSMPSQPLVLIVEPEHRAAELLVNYLEPEGFDTLRTRCTAQALSMAADLSADAVVVDLVSPSGDEWKLIDGLRQNSGTASVPVIVISVSEADDLGRSLGASAHLTKPVGKKVLLEALAKFIQSSASLSHEILIVDDESNAGELLSAFLSEAGYQPRFARGGAEALDSLAQHRPSAVILDLMMPGMSGFEVLARLKENPDWATIPVLVLTGLELKPGDVALLQRTAVAILNKGSSWKKPLIDALRKLTPARAE